MLIDLANGPSNAQVDLNCDMGEGMPTDAAIFPFISSANIACGGHAGDEDTMRRTIELALQHNVAIGAHPSYPDRANFGRIDMLDHDPDHPDHDPTTPGARLYLRDLAGILTSQLGQLQKVCTSFGTRLRHVKPHGALYNRAAKDAAVSDVICQTILAFDPSLLLYGLSGSEMKRRAQASGLRFVSEVFADRTYREDGSLTPRTEPHALIEDPAAAVQQVLKMLRPPFSADTICIHGDGLHAVEFARTIHGMLLQNGISITY
jgi:5-oxoprolinase (ATP-hydrolysing) subunit A